MFFRKIYIFYTFYTKIMRVLEQVEEKKGVRLDAKDKKILSTLARNARTPSTAIAKKIGMSRDAVGYRIKTYQKNNVLQGTRTLINVEKLGYQVYHLFIQVDPSTKEKEKELIQKLKAYPFVRAIIKFSGKYDYELALIAKDMHELDEILMKIVSDCEEYLEFLQDYELLIITHYYVEHSFPRSFIKTMQQEEITTSKEKQNAKEKSNLDIKDMNILKKMANNAAQPLYSVANQIGISADAVKYRLNKMTDRGVIKKFVPIINYAALGYSIYAFLLNVRGLTGKKEAQLKQVLKEDKNILWAVKTIGRYNVLTYVCVQNTDDLHKTLMNIRGHFPGEIRNYETLIAYAEYKYTYFPEGTE